MKRVGGNEYMVKSVYTKEFIMKNIKCVIKYKMKSLIEYIMKAV